MNSFTILDQVFTLRVDRSRTPLRMGRIAEIDPNGETWIILETYKSFIRGEIRHTDRGRWDLIVGQLTEQDILEVSEWIMGPWLKRT